MGYTGKVEFRQFFTLAFMGNPARIVGYLTSVLILVFILMLLGLVRREATRGPLLVEIRFENVGTLRNDDPVIHKGVRVGEVDGISRVEGTAKVTLELYQHIALPADSRFMNFNYSLFGDRLILIFEGRSDAIMDFNEVQQGIFKAGIAETMHKVDTILVTVRGYEELLKELFFDQDSGLTVTQLFRERLLPAFAEIEKVITGLTDMEAPMNRTLTQVSRTGKQITELTREAATGGSAMLGDAEQMLASLSGVLEQSQSLLTRIEESTDKLQDPESTGNRLLMQRQLFDSMVKFTESLNALIRLLKQEGIQDIINFRRNVKILGPNPTRQNRNMP